MKRALSDARMLAIATVAAVGTIGGLALAAGWMLGRVAVLTVADYLPKPKP